VNPRKVNPVNPKKFSEACHLISSEVAQRRIYVLGQYRTQAKSRRLKWTKEEIMIIDKTDCIDKVLTCLDCGREFTFASGEQRYFWAKGLSEPKRCKSCRMLRKRSLVSITTIDEDDNASN